MRDTRTSRGWRLLLAPPRPGAENMARDTALMQRARDTGETVFCVYTWAAPTLSFGRNQLARGRYDMEAITRRRVDVVRRPTGGRALLHHHEVTYSVTAPVAGNGSLHKSYARINAILLGGLARLGVSAAAARPFERTPPPTELPCFASPSAGELVASGSKLIGSAQVRENGALLQHGSILVEDDQGIISELLASGTPAMQRPRAATLSAELGRTPELEEVAESLFDAVRDLEDPDASPLDESEVRDATRQHLATYASESWTWRR